MFDKTLLLDRVVECGKLCNYSHRRICKFYEIYPSSREEGLKMSFLQFRYMSGCLKVLKAILILASHNMHFRLILN